MERREFIKIVCGFVGAWPLAAEAQGPGNQRLIGVLGADATAWGPWTVALTARLRELGWSEGDNLAIEYRWAQGRSDRVSEFAAEFERRKVDVIVTYGAAVTILKQTITSIPIVFAVAFDPVRSGLVQSLANPAGNVTGVSIQQPDLVGKRLKLLRQAIPELRRLGILADAGYAEPMLEADRGTRRGCDGMESVDGCFNRALARTRLERGRQCGDRVSLGPGKIRSRQ